MANHISRGTEKFPKPDKQPRLLNLALPNDMRCPAVSTECDQVSDVALTVAIDLLRPIFRVGLRLPGTAGAIMTVPEAAVDEDNLTPACENEIRLSRQRLAVQPVSVASGVQQVAHGPFWLRILGFDSLHSAPAQRL